MYKEIVDPDKYRLCFVRNNILYFTDNFENQWGDDWNDHYYSCNAETPYELKMTEDLVDKDGKNSNRGHIVRMGADVSCLTFPDDMYSVEEINLGAVAWLFGDYYDYHGDEKLHNVCIHGGDTLGEVDKKLTAAGVFHGLLF